MTLFWHPTGPLLKYEDGVLYVEDLNPEVKTRWTMSRAEMLKLGWRCIRAALQRQRPAPIAAAMGSLSGGKITGDPRAIRSGR